MMQILKFKVGEKLNDNVNPQHYKGKKFEVIEIIDDYNLNFSLGNAIKYVLRAGKKTRIHIQRI